MYVTEPLESIVDQYDAVLEQLAHHGLEVGEQSRLASYRSALLQLIRLQENDQEDVNDRDKAELMELCFEATEALIAIHGAAQQDELSPLERRSIRRVISGPNIARNEDAPAGDNESRNLAFELIIANKLRASGIENVVMAEPDIVFTFRDCEFFVACKRPQGHQINLRGQHRAISQLASRANRQVAARLGAHQRNMGMLAIDISKFANPDGQGIIGENPEEAENFMRARGDFLLEHFAQNWDTNQNSRLHGVLVRFACVMIINNPKRFLHAQDWIVTPTRNAGMWERAKLRGLTTAMDN